LPQPRRHFGFALATELRPLAMRFQERLLDQVRRIEFALQVLAQVQPRQENEVRPVLLEVQIRGLVGARCHSANIAVAAAGIGRRGVIESAKKVTQLSASVPSTAVIWCQGNLASQGNLVSGNLVSAADLFFGWLGEGKTDLTPDIQNRSDTGYLTPDILDVHRVERDARRRTRSAAPPDQRLSRGP
jgi:hypothetical protein